VAGRIRVIPNLIDLDCRSIKPSVSLSLHFQAQGTNAVLNFNRHDSITEVTSGYAHRATIKSNLITKKRGNENGPSQYLLQLTSLLHFISHPPPLGRVFLSSVDQMPG
jgi:hypothetical protein